MSYSNPKERELLARVERLETELKRLRLSCDALSQAYAAERETVERLRALAQETWRTDVPAELERLREQVKWLGPERNENEVTRLHRIEKAAREMFRVIDSTKGAQDTRPWSNALRAALEEEV